MKKLWKEFRCIPNVNWLVISLFSSIIVTYGYQVTHPTIGMDDTNIRTYFIDGLAPQVGRWTLFLLNKVFFMAEYTPYFMDVLGLIFLGLSVCVFCVLFKRISHNRLHAVSYVFFALFFVTSPFMGEVYIYYLHNGVGLAFLLTAVSILCLWNVISEKKILEIIPAVIGISMAIGCYESFALVYLTGISIVVFGALLYDSYPKKKIQGYFMDAVCFVCPLVLAVLSRRIISTIITNSLGLDLMQRTASSMKYWFMNNPVILVKDLILQFVLRYIISGKYFFGAFVYACSAFLFLGVIIYSSICKKKIGIFLFGCAIELAPWLLIPIELKITPYRAGQALMFFIGFVWLCIIELLFSKDGLREKSALAIMRVTIIIVAFVFIFNQGFQLNAYFYYDYLKDKNDEKVCMAIGDELQQHYDVSKPVVFVGTYMMPRHLVDWFYVAAGTGEFEKLKKMLNYNQRQVGDNYVNEYGYKIYEVGSEDLLNWMLWAKLDGERLEIYNYMYMLGYDFIVPSKEQRKDAWKYIPDIEYQSEGGAIVDVGEYIIVKFEAWPSEADF